MAQYELNLRDYWYIAKKRQGIILFTVLVVFGFTLLFTQLLKPDPLYEATASVKYDRTSTLAGLYLEIISYSPTDVMATQTVVIKSYPVMEKVAKKLGLVPQDFSAKPVLSQAEAATGKGPAETPRPEAPASLDETAGTAVPSEEHPTTPARFVTRIKTDPIGEDLRVTIQGDGVFEPEVFAVGPEMLVVDLPGITYLGMTQAIPVQNAVVKQIRVDQRVDPKMVRVVLSLANAAPYTVDQKGSALVILFKQAAVRPPQDPTPLNESPVAPSKQETKSAPVAAQATTDDLKKIFDLQERVKTQQEGTTNIIRITARDSDPEGAARLANTVALTYREENIAIRNREVLSAQKFIEAQLKVVGDRLREAEQELRSFKEQEQRVFLTDEAKALLSSLTHVESEYEKIKRTVDETRNQLAELRARSFLAEGPSERIFTEEASALVFALNADLLKLLQERDTLLINYTSQHPQVKELDQKIQNVRNEMIRELTSKLSTYEDREAVLREQTERQRLDYLKVPMAALKLARLEREVRVNEEIYSQLKSKHEEVMIKAAEQIEEVTLIAPAFAPARPVNAPKTTMNMTVGGFIGLLLGIVAAFTRESLDASLGTIEETEEFLGIPVLGVIPSIDIGDFKESAEKEQRREERRKKEPAVYAGLEGRIGPRRLTTKNDAHLKLISLYAPQSRVAESYRTLRTNIAFATANRDFKILQFTSAGLREGKTTTAINLAVTLAQMGKRILILDADLRKPSVHDVFGLKKEPGLTEILLGRYSWKDAIRTVADLMIGTLGVEEVIGSPGLDKISILTSGQFLSNPAELISSPKMSALLDDLRGQFDLVIVDTPPILPVADAVMMGSKTDGVLLVYQVGQIPRLALKRAKQLLEKGQANVLGVVLNNVRAEISLDYQQVKYGYLSKEAEEAAQTRPSRWTFLTQLFKK